MVVKIHAYIKCAVEWFCTNWKLETFILTLAKRVECSLMSPGRVIPKTQKIVLDTFLLNTQYYKVRIKGKLKQSKERSSVLPLYLGEVAIEKGAFGSPSTIVINFYTFISNGKYGNISFSYQYMKQGTYFVRLW